MTYHNDYLWPATEKPIKKTIHPHNLGVAISEVDHLPYAIAAAVSDRGYAFPLRDILYKTVRIKTGDDRLTATFPPPLPGIGDTITVLDATYQARTLQVGESNQDALTAELYLDLDTGEWVTFTTKTLQTGFGHTSFFPSRAARQPAPVPE